MLLKWLNAREATEIGKALADDFVLQTAGGGSSARSGRVRPAKGGKNLQEFLQKFLQRVDRDAGPLELNIFKRAKLANSFKWRLLEKGVDRQIVDELTQALVMRLSTGQGGAAAPQNSSTAFSGRANIASLLAQANDSMARGDYSKAVTIYQDLLQVDRRNAVAHNNLGGAHWKLGNYKQAEEEFRLAIGIRESYPDALGNLGTVLRARGRIAESEMPLRRALKLKPTQVEALSSLGQTLVVLGRLSEAKDCFEKVLRVSPRHAQAAAGIAQTAALEGRFGEAEAAYRRALEIDPKNAGAWAALARLRKMTSTDRDWLKGAESSLSAGLTPLDEADLRYAMGKYFDDIGEYARAFRCYERANELQRMATTPYDRAAWTGFVDDLIDVYNSEALARTRPGASNSQLPVIVVGMPRSGTSLVEQIIASHPSASGAGELDFWGRTVQKHEATMRTELPSEGLTRKLTSSYLRILEAHSKKDALRVVDKTTFNSDLLGIVHAVFPAARMIYLRRDPIDTCLSCYFHQLPATLTFCTDLEDLAHYYREHRRLIEHWRAALPRGALLDVPYGELTGDQEHWSRKIVEFLGLEWDQRCLDFHQTQRAVVTASYWQVRQKMYKSSVGRWRNYEKFIGPLLSLKGME